MMSEDFNFVRDALGWIVATAITVFVALKRTLRLGAYEDAQKEHERAAESLVKGLRVELERLGRQNGLLAETVHDLQQRLADINSEVIQLRNENALQVFEVDKLRTENTKLQDEMALLHAEVRTLRQSAEP